MEGERKALSDKNSSNDTVFSHTTVSSGATLGKGPGEAATDNDVSTASMSSIGPYHEFAVSALLLLFMKFGGKSILVGGVALVNNGRLTFLSSGDWGRLY